MIWKGFVEQLDEDESLGFDYPPYLGASSTWVVNRNGRWQLDNGYCRGSRLIAYFSGEAPDSEADCKPNEVSVPLVLGMTEAGAEATLAARPLGAKVVYRPAKAGALPGLVVDQDPRRGGLSAHDEVTVVVSKALHGLLPNFVGSSLADVQREAKRLKVRLRPRPARGHLGTVLRQVPEPGVAIAPGMRVTLVVGDGSRK
jgi:hypothetical protein